MHYGHNTNGMGRCKFCGEKIRWVQMSNGRPLPCNPDKSSIVWIDRANQGCIINGYTNHLQTSKATRKGPEDYPGPIG